MSKLTSSSKPRLSENETDHQFDGRQERSVHRREAILKAATIEFAEQGLAGARVDRIASQAGANKQGLYYHFGSKEALFKAVLIAAFEGLVPNVSDVLQDKNSCQDKIAALVNALFDQVSRHSWVLTIITFENLQKGANLDEEVRQKMTASTRPFIEAMQRSIEEGQSLGVFRQDLDSMWVVSQLFALVEFHFIRRFTVTINSGRDPLVPDEVASWRNHILDVMMATLMKPICPKD